MYLFFVRFRSFLLRRPSHWIQRRFVAELIYLGLSIVRPKWAAPRVYVTVVGNWAFWAPARRRRQRRRKSGATATAPREYATAPKTMRRELPVTPHHAESGGRLWVLSVYCASRFRWQMDGRFSRVLRGGPRLAMDAPMTMMTAVRQSAMASAISAILSLSHPFLNRKTNSTTHRSLLPLPPSSLGGFRPHSHCRSF